MTGAVSLVCLACFQRWMWSSRFCATCVPCHGILPLKAPQVSQGCLHRWCHPVFASDQRLSLFCFFLLWMLCGGHLNCSDKKGMRACLSLLSLSRLIIDTGSMAGYYTTAFKLWKFLAIWKCSVHSGYNHVTTINTAIYTTSGTYLAGNLPISNWKENNNMLMVCKFW